MANDVIYKALIKDEYDDIYMTFVSHNLINMIKVVLEYSKTDENFKSFEVKDGIDLVISGTEFTEDIIDFIVNYEHKELNTLTDYKDLEEIEIAQMKMLKEVLKKNNVLVCAYCQENLSKENKQELWEEAECPFCHEPLDKIKIIKKEQKELLPQEHYSKGKNRRFSTRSPKSHKKETIGTWYNDNMLNSELYRGI